MYVTESISVRTEVNNVSKVRCGWCCTPDWSELDCLELVRGPVLARVLVRISSRAGARCFATLRMFMIEGPRASARSFIKLKTHYRDVGPRIVIVGICRTASGIRASKLIQNNLSTPQEKTSIGVIR